MNNKTRVLLIIIVVILLPMTAILQKNIDPQRAQFLPGKKGVGALMTNVDNNPVVLPGQFMIGALVGFREVIAGILWVKCDEFFHNGQYETVVPLVRMITWLDPHQIDVYCTGAWHIGYNFTDSGQRADYRYMPAAIALLKEGIQNNQGIYDPEQDLGFNLYQLKMYDLPQCIYWLRKAEAEKDSQYSISRLIAHALEKNGQLDECERQWRKCLKMADEQLARNPADAGARLHKEVSQRNYDEFLVRRTLYADLARQPADVHFDAQFKKLSSRVFQITGTANVPDSTRVRIEILQNGFKLKELKGFTWAIDQDATYLMENGMHGAMVQKGKFSRKYDLTLDTKQYPFKAENYTLKITLDPVDNTGVEARNKLGFTGEGLADQMYLDTSVKGFRRLQKVIHLKRSDFI